MARPMNQLPTSKNALVVFARDLRALRRRAGNPPLALMQQRCGVSAATLSNAHGGEQRPTWKTVRGYVGACGGDPEEWRTAWNLLRLELAAPDPDVCAHSLTRWARTGQITPPDTVADHGELCRLLRTLLTFHGMSLRGLARQAPGYSHDTYGALLRGTRPLSATTLKSVLLGCGVHSLNSLDQWFNALGQVDGTQATPGARIVEAMRQKTDTRWARDRNTHAVAATVTYLEKSVEDFRKQQTAPQTAGGIRENVRELRKATTLVLQILAKCVEQTTDSTAPQLLQHSLNIVREFETGRGWPSKRFLDGFIPLALPHEQHLQLRVHEALLTGLGFLHLADKGKLDPHVQLSLQLSSEQRVGPRRGSAGAQNGAGPGLGWSHSQRHP
ncbi:MULTISPECIES: hypothetical protein [unclassified Streptomyces]|uniref:hypothetical protein n=1 Tax=unclassified Streptomyces TaxID=2593676 RepID=UPI003420A84C